MGRLRHGAWQGSCRHADGRGRIERVVRVLIPPGEGRCGAVRDAPPQWQRPLPLPARHAAPWPAGGQRPGQRPLRHRRALLARRVGRWPAGVPGPAGLRGTVPHGLGKSGAFPDPPGGAIPFPGSGRFPGRQAVGLLSQHPAKDASWGTRSVRSCRAAHQLSGPLSMYRRARKSMKARTLGCVKRPGG